MRVGGARTATWFARRGVVAEKYMKCCPCCGKEVPETVELIILRCHRWRKGRKEMLGTMIREANSLTSMIEAERSHAKVALLIGGEHKGKQLENWDTIPNRQSEKTPRGKGGKVEPKVRDGVLSSMSLDERVMGSGALRIAAFLQWMVGLRDPIIKGMRRCPPSTEDQRPNG